MGKAECECFNQKCEDQMNPQRKIQLLINYYSKRMGEVLSDMSCVPSGMSGFNALS